MKYIIFCTLIGLLLACGGCATTDQQGNVYVPKFTISCFGISGTCEWTPVNDGLK